MVIGLDWWRRRLDIPDLVDRRNLVDEPFRKRRRPMVGHVDMDPDDFTPTQTVRPAFGKDFQLEGDTCAPLAANTHADFDAVVKADRRAVFDQRLDQMKIGRFGRKLFVIGNAHVAEELGDRGIEVGQVVRVEYHALHVHFAIAHPHGMEEGEVLSGHGRPAPCCRSQSPVTVPPRLRRVSGNGWLDDLLDAPMAAA